MILIYFSEVCQARVRLWVLVSARYFGRLWATLWGLWSPVLRGSRNRSDEPCRVGRSEEINAPERAEIRRLDERHARQAGQLHGSPEQFPSVRLRGVAVQQQIFWRDVGRRNEPVVLLLHDPDLTLVQRYLEHGDQIVLRELGEDGATDQVR